MKPYPRLDSLVSEKTSIHIPFLLGCSFLYLRSAIRNHAYALVPLCVGLFLTIALPAQTVRVWQPTAGGAWSTASNWLPIGAPVNNDIVVISKDQTGPITGVPNVTLKKIRVEGNCQFEPSSTNQTVTVSDSFFLAQGKTFSFGILNSKMNFTLAATAIGDINGQFIQNAATPAGTFNCSGVLTMAADGVIKGTGAFSLNSGATIRVAAANGIMAGVVQSGNIQVTGLRTYHPAANYEYIGTVAQVTGDGFPDQLTGSFTIMNENGVTLSANRTIASGRLLLNGGAFQVSNRLTMGGNTTSAAATIIRTQGTLTGTLQGANWYTLVYAGATKTTGDELLGTGLRNLRVSLANGEKIIMATGRTLPGTLELSGGTIRTDNFKLILSNSAPGAIVGGSINAYVEGNLQRSISAGANSYVYPIGSAEGYAPVTLQFTANTVAGTLTGYTLAGDYTQIGSSKVNPIRSVNRTWNFTVNSGLGTVGYGAVFNWLPGDQDPSFDYNNAIIGRYFSGGWNYPAVLNKTLTSLQAGSLNAFGDFQVGKICVNTKIDIPPVTSGICNGDNTTLSVAAVGEGTLSYQWLAGGQDIQDATATAFTTGVPAFYQVRVTAECGTVLSDAAEVFYKRPTSIDVQPVGGAKCAGDQLNVVANGSGTLNYQWEKDGQTLVTGANAYWAVAAPGAYTVRVTGECGVVTSDTSLVTIHTPTSILKQPQDLAITYGDNASFLVGAAGTGTISYRWQEENSAAWDEIGAQFIGGQDTVSLLNFTSPAVAKNGTRYRVVVHALCGEVVSDPVTLTVNKADLIVKADTLVKFYGAAMPVLTASYFGFKNGENRFTSGMAGDPELSTTAGTYSNIGMYPVALNLGTLSAANYNLIPQYGALSIVATTCSSIGSLQIADNCPGSPLQLTFQASSGTGPFTIVINDSAYKNISSGIPFYPGSAMSTSREKIWGDNVIGEDPAVFDNAAVELGFKFKVNVAGEIKGIRYYKLADNTGVHTGTLWRADGMMLATATFTNETSAGWQQVDFAKPIAVQPGVTYVASYFAPNGRYSYTANAFDSTLSFTSPSGNVIAMSKQESLGNGVYKYGGGFPSDVSPSNANYYVDVVFQIPVSNLDFQLTGVISAAGCATNALPIQQLNVPVKPNIGVTLQKPYLKCMNSTDGYISLTATGCNAPFIYSKDGGATYQSDATFANLAAGTYTFRIRDARNDFKDTTVILDVDKAVWTGAVSTDWHNPGNWSTQRVPTSITHVIIPATANRCQIASDAVAASIQVSQGVTFRVLNNRKMNMTGSCTELPKLQ